MTLKRDVEEDVMLSGMMMLGAVIYNAQVQIHEDTELPLRHPKKPEISGMMMLGVDICKCKSANSRI